MHSAQLMAISCARMLSRQNAILNGFDVATKISAYTRWVDGLWMELDRYTSSPFVYLLFDCGEDRPWRCQWILIGIEMNANQRQLQWLHSFVTNDRCVRYVGGVNKPVCLQLFTVAFIHCGCPAISRSIEQRKWVTQKVLCHNQRWVRTTLLHTHTHRTSHKQSWQKKKIIINNKQWAKTLCRNFWMHRIIKSDSFSSSSFFFDSM